MDVEGLPQREQRPQKRAVTVCAIRQVDFDSRRPAGQGILGILTERRAKTSAYPADRYKGDFIS